MREISGRRRSQRALTALLALATLLGLLALPAPPRAHAAGGGLAGTPFGLGPVWAPGTEYDKAFDGSTGNPPLGDDAGGGRAAGSAGAGVRGAE